MASKNIAQHVAGFFFEDTSKTPEQNPEQSPDGGIDPALLAKLQGGSSLSLDELNKSLEGKNPAVNSPQLNETPVNKQPAAPIVNGDIVDFTPIYKEAQIQDAPLSAEEFLQLLAELGDMPLAAKRTMAETMLRAMAKQTPNLTSDTIEGDALAKIKALASYSDGVNAQLKSFVADRTKAIADAEAKIEAEKKALDAATKRVAQITDWCKREGNVLNNVITFFNPGAVDSGSAT
jgi:hypothetical protein